MKKRKEVEIEEEEEEISKDEKLSGAQMFGVWDLGSEWGADIQNSNWWLRGHLGGPSESTPAFSCLLPSMAIILFDVFSFCI